MKIIVADDSLVMRKIVSKVLDSMGYEAVHASNGRDVLNCLEAHGDEVKLILLDLNMPVLDGKQVLINMKENGLINYLKHFCGPVPALAILIFPVEIISTTLRILTLNLRLYWNISADHMVMSGFVDQVFGPSGIVIYVLALFVSFMQAFIFTTLSMVYILLAVQHEEEH